MEELNLVELALLVVSPLLLVGLVFLRKYVKNSEAKWDDELLAKVDEAIAKSKKDAE